MRRGAILLLITGILASGISLLPDFAPWVRIRGCDIYAYDAWSGPTGFGIAATLLMVLPALVGLLAERPGRWWLSLVGGGAIIVAIAGASIGQFDFLVARRPAPLDTCDLFAGIPRGSESLALAHGPWLALVGGILVLSAGLLARVTPRGSASQHTPEPS